MSGGGGGGGNTTATTYSTNIPEYAQPYVMNMLGKAEALTASPYQPYTGERTAQFTPLQQQAFQGIGALAPSANNAAGSDAAMQVIQGGLNPNSWTQAGIPQQYMSPYMQNVVDVQQREAQRAADIATQGRNAQAVGAGAFGGARQAITDAEAQRNLALQKGDIQKMGLQSAYTQGMGQFNTEEAARLQGLGATLSGAGVLGQLGQAQFGQQSGAAQMQLQAGAGQQKQVQDILSQQASDYMTQMNYPYTQLSYMSDLLRGTGNLAQQSAVYKTTPEPSVANQIAGLGLGAYGAFGRMAAGGAVRPGAGLMDLAMSYA